MKAIRVYEFGEPEVLKLEQIPELQPGKKQVVIRVHAAGVNPLDNLLRMGIPIGEYEINLPYTPGYELAGDVIAVGEGVKRIKVGDRVYAETISGSYAEQALCREDQVYPLPSHISYTQGSTIYVAYKTAYFSLFELGQAKLGDVVLIHGASGTVGTAAVQLARTAGVTIIGTAGSESGMDTIKAQGAQFALNHHSEDYLQQISQITQGRGVNVVLEMVANANLNKDLGVVAVDGRIVVVGSHGNEAIVDPNAIIGKGATLVGVNLFSVSPRLNEHIHMVIAAGLQNGSLTPASCEELPLLEAVKAHKMIATGQNSGRIALIM